MPIALSNTTVNRSVLIAGFLIAAFNPCIASAALGEPEASVMADVTMMRGTLTVVDSANYRSHEIKTSSGIVVHEFTGVDGKVFAIVWRGPAMPNLRQALGQYFDSYVAAAKGNRSGLQFGIHNSDLVVHSAGHMRAFSGIAYLPQAIPSGVSIGELQ